MPKLGERAPVVVLYLRGLLGVPTLP